MGSLVDVHSKTQAAQAESSVLPLPAPFSVPPRNTVVDADPPPVTSSPVHTSRWNGVCHTDHTGILEGQAPTRAQHSAAPSAVTSFCNWFCIQLESLGCALFSKN